MPEYDVECLDCGFQKTVTCKIAERNQQRCDECSGAMKVVHLSVPPSDWFKPFTSEDFDGTPIEVKSKRHFKELCLKHGVTSRALGDVRNIREI